MTQGQRRTVAEAPWPHSITDDHIRSAALTLGLPQDAFLSEEIAHRRIHILIGTSYVDTFVLQHRRKRRHRCAAHSDQVHATWSGRGRH